VLGERIEFNFIQSRKVAEPGRTRWKGKRLYADNVCGSSMRDRRRAGPKVQICDPFSGNCRRRAHSANHGRRRADVAYCGFDRFGRSNAPTGISRRSRRAFLVTWSPSLGSCAGGRRNENGPPGARPDGLGAAARDRDGGAAALKFKLLRRNLTRRTHSWNLGHVDSSRLDLSLQVAR
jgi:hypothetical protein